MNLSPALRPACQKCLQCIQGSLRWAAGGTVTGNKRHRAACSGSQQWLQRHLTPRSTAEMIFHLQLLVSLRPRASSRASHSERPVLRLLDAFRKKEPGHKHPVSSAPLGLWHGAAMDRSRADEALCSRHATSPWPPVLLL